MLELILSAIQAIMQVMVVVLLGVVLSFKGYISNDNQKWLSKLNLVFFTPCLLFSNIASVISFERLLAFWPIPVFYLIFTFISWILCQITLPIFGIDKYYRRFVIACVMFCNTNSLPVAIISSLAVSEAGKTLYWGKDDNQSLASARGISYALFFGLFCNILRWSYGYNLLQKKPDDDDTIVDDDTSIYSTTISYGSLSIENDTSRRSSSATVSDQQYGAMQKKYTIIHNNDQDDRETAHILLGHSSPTSATSIMDQLKVFLKSIDNYMSPPLYAALLALCVGLCPPIKQLLFDPDSFLYVPLTKAIESCGKASVPVVLVCLGAQLKGIRDTQQETSPKYRQPVSLTLFIRMLLVPVCVLLLVYAFAKYGSRWSELADDPMFIVTMVIVGCTPTSINLAQITLVSGVFEEEMLHVLFWSYGVVCIPICTLVVFLALCVVS